MEKNMMIILAVVGVAAAVAVAVGVYILLDNDDEGITGDFEYLVTDEDGKVVGKYEISYQKGRVISTTYTPDDTIVATDPVKAILENNKVVLVLPDKGSFKDPVVNPKLNDRNKLIKDDVKLFDEIVTPTATINGDKTLTAYDVNLKLTGAEAEACVILTDASGVIYQIQQGNLTFTLVGVK